MYEPKGIIEGKLRSLLSSVIMEEMLASKHNQGVVVPPYTDPSFLQHYNKMESLQKLVSLYLMAKILFTDEIQVSKLSMIHQVLINVILLSLKKALRREIALDRNENLGSPHFLHENTRYIWRQECVEVAKEISEKTKKPLPCEINEQALDIKDWNLILAFFKEYLEEGVIYKEDGGDVLKEIEKPLHSLTFSISLKKNILLLLFP